METFLNFFKGIDSLKRWSKILITFLMLVFIFIVVWVIFFVVYFVYILLTRTKTAQEGIELISDIIALAWIPTSAVFLFKISKTLNNIEILINKDEKKWKKIATK